MFRAIPMMRANILILDRDLAVVTKELGRMGFLHLLEVGKTPGLSDRGWTPGKELEVVSRYQVAKRLLDEVIEDTGISQEDSYTSIQFKVDPLKDIDELENKIEDLHNQIKTTNEELFSLRDRLTYEEDNLKKARNMIGVNADLAQMRSLLALHISFGNISNMSIRDIEDYITTKNTTLVPIGIKGDKGVMAFFCLPEDADALGSQLKSIGFEPIPFPEDCSGTPENAIREIEARIEDIKVSITEHEERLKGFGWTYRSELLRIKEHVTTNLDILMAVKSMGLSESTALISGWIPREGVAKLEKTLKDILGDLFYLSFTRPEDIEEVREGKVKVPVIFKNPKLLRPFEALVTTYGSPEYHEVEPSSIVGIAFLLMFGVMFGDVGHGMVLFTIGLLIKRKIKGAENLAEIMKMAGASSMLFGLFFGEIFGYPVINHPFVFHPMAHDRDNITPFMSAAIIYGIIFISVGLIINVINAIKAKDIERGFLENHGLAGAFFYWGAVAILVKYLVTGKLGIPIWGVLLILGLPLFIIFMREPIYHLIKNKRPLVEDPVSYFLGSIVEVLDTFTGFLSNTISFIRVAAFSMAHIALMTAIFKLMALIESGVLSLIVQIVGNIVVIALEGLVVSIQSVRLIYYEFFSKFYSGEGEPFIPMKIGAFQDNKFD